MPAEERAVHVGDVAGGVDVRVGGAQRRVDQDPVVHGQAGRLGQPGVRPDADPGQHGVGRHGRAVGEDDLPGPDLPHPGAQPQVDPVLPVQVGEDLPHLVAEDPVQRLRVGLHQGDLGAVLAGGRGRLQPDPAGADHDHPGAGAERGADPVGVRQPAQRQHGVAAGHRQRAHHRAGGQQQLRVPQPLAAGQLDLVLGRLQRADRRAEPQVDVVLGVPLRRVHPGRLPLLLAEQVALGQRRSLVRRLVLVAEQHHRPVEALGAQRLGRLRAGQAGAHDDVRVHGSSFNGW